MNEKYSIPGLFIKPSTKDAPKSVEAKLTLSPVEGKISLTAKVKEEKGGSYQSSIYTPSKSPVMETKVPTSSSSSISAKDENKVSGVSLSSVVETGVARKESSYKIRDIANLDPWTCPHSHSHCVNQWDNSTQLSFSKQNTEWVEHSFIFYDL